MKLSVVIPAHNEADCIGETVGSITERLAAEGIDYEIVVVDDNSSDGTGTVVDEIARRDDRKGRVICVRSVYEPGFGLAVRIGLERYTGDCVAIMMGDGSDSPSDLVTYYGLLEEGYDCAFGSRFIRGAHVHDYPKLKKLLNRVVNFGINVMFGLRYNDTTNAFKAYRREVIDSVQPLLSKHFNLTVEIPLKAVIRGSSFVVTPISWTNRTSGTSKLKLKEMGSRYLFIVLYAFLERHLSRSDYRRADSMAMTSRNAPTERAEVANRIPSHR